MIRSDPTEELLTALARVGARMSAEIDRIAPGVVNASHDMNGMLELVRIGARCQAMADVSGWIQDEMASVLAQIKSELP